MPITPGSLLSSSRAVRGPLIAEFVFSRAVRNRKSTEAEFAASAGSWAVTGIGAEAGFAANVANRLNLPHARPDGWFGLVPVAEVDSVPFGGGTVMPWAGGAVYNAGIGGAVLQVSEAARLSLRTYVNAAPCQIRVYGGGTAIPSGAVVKLYAAVS